jgi:hypothetical protein
MKKLLTLITLFVPFESEALVGVYSFIITIVSRSIEEEYGENDKLFG